MKATTVEECHVLDVKRLVEEGVITPGSRQSGQLIWKDARTGKEWASIRYTALVAQAVGLLWLAYTSMRTGKVIACPVFLHTTVPPFGGLRWYFSCPLVVNGKRCGRRAAKLYLPYYGRYFGCRHCYRLTYRKCQASDKRISRLCGNPELMEELLESDTLSDTILMLKAVFALSQKGPWEYMLKETLEIRRTEN